ncbi:Protein lin-9 [Orchesella cincta]|uniref:Protein lin-9 n=1 Tax=Orchesella cincta TaxID=48709 RepID=A0A1D2MLJ6_ORCCI|nr:Protein lin-9 [Orchesella cincta]
MIPSNSCRSGNLGFRPPEELPKVVNKTGVGTQIYEDRKGHLVRAEVDEDFSTSTALQEVRPLAQTGCLDIDIRTYKRDAERLKNFILLPRAYLWLCHEWFYSPIDRVIFKEPNDFEACLNEYFPNLKARKLRRVEWVEIRRIMGKPRRLSPAFLENERRDVAKRRELFRHIQQKRIPSQTDHNDLPDEIPMHLVVGTKVTAILRGSSSDGLFTGQVSGINVSNHTYRIFFDRATLGRKSVLDYEVMPDDPPDTLSVSSMGVKLSRTSVERAIGTYSSSGQQLSKSFSAGGFQSSRFSKDTTKITIGGFPAHLLYSIVRLKKLLGAKCDQTQKLKQLNVEAEKLFSYDKRYPKDLVFRYSTCISFMDKLNTELSMHCDAIYHHLSMIANEKATNQPLQLILPKQVSENSFKEAEMIVSSLSTKLRTGSNKRIVNLVTSFASLMLQLKMLSAAERNHFETKSIVDTVESIKASLMGSNVKYFQNRIEIPVNRIRAGLCRVKHSKTGGASQLKRKRRC